MFEKKMLIKKMMKWWCKQDHSLTIYFKKKKFKYKQYNYSIIIVSNNNVKGGIE